MMMQDWTAIFLASVCAIFVVRDVVRPFVTHSGCGSCGGCGKNQEVVLKIEAVKK
jgi:hypothetical protein